MPQRSTVDQLPEDIRKKINFELINNGFSNYRQLVDKLAEWGYTISKTALHRYGQEYERELFDIREATEQARGLVEACGDDENALAEAVTRLVYQKCLRALMKMNIDDAEIPATALTFIGKMVADLNKSSVVIKKYQAEVRKRLDEKLKQLEAEAAKTGEGEQNKGRKLDKETLRTVREEIYGIV